MAKLRSSLSALILGWVLSACVTPQPPEPNPDWLWVPVWADSTVVAFGPEELALGGNAVLPRVAIGLGGDLRPYTLAFDADDNLWIGNQNGDIVRIDAQDLRSSGTPVPGVTLRTGHQHVAAIAFGPDGRLWAAVLDRILGWRPDQLGESGTIAADVEITANGVTLMYANSLAFDQEGGLWVGNGGHVFRYAPTQLVVSGAHAPDVILLPSGGSLNDVRGLAFDPTGALWVTTMGSNVAEKYLPGDLAASGTPTPFVTLSGLGLWALRPAFDSDGNLWVSSLYDPGWSMNGYLARVPPPNQVSSGGGKVDVTFSSLGGFDTGGHLVFWPGPE